MDFSNVPQLLLAIGSSVGAGSIFTLIVKSRIDKKKTDVEVRAVAADISIKADNAVVEAAKGLLKSLQDEIARQNTRIGEQAREMRVQEETMRAQLHEVRNLKTATEGRLLQVEQERQSCLHRIVELEARMKTMTDQLTQLQSRQT